MDLDRLVILADDFTGACDAAGAFGVARHTLVVLDAPHHWPAAQRRSLSAEIELEVEVEVLSVDLDLRERSDDVARDWTQAAAQRVASVAPAARLFLKIDSTLRGPIAGLVAGTLSGSGKDVAVIAPAFPEQGRLLHEGRSVVDGRAGHSLIEIFPAADTVLLRAGSTRSISEFEQAVEDARRQGARHVVVDADGPACLATVASAWTRHADWLLVGSGGLARHVSHQAPAAALELRAVHGPIVVVAGSPSPMTRAQLELVRPLASVTVVEAGSAPPAAPGSGEEVLVLCTPPASERDAGQCAQAVADAVFAWSSSLQPGALVLAGGATARLVCERLGAIGVALQGELAPGVPIGHLVGGRWDTVMVVTKAGGFGTPTTLLDAVRVLAEMGSTSARRVGND